jgi:hypothetical protein
MPGSNFRPFTHSLTLSSVARDLVHLLMITPRSRRALAREFIRSEPLTTGASCINLAHEVKYSGIADAARRRKVDGGLLLPGRRGLNRAKP